MWENQSPLRNSVDVTHEPSASQVLEERGVEERLPEPIRKTGKVISVGLIKRKVVKEFDRRAQPCGDREPAIEGRRSKKQVKGTFTLREARLPIAICHGQFVEIGEQRERPLDPRGH
jgi:hypothetical protein